MRAPIKPRLVSQSGTPLAHKTMVSNNAAPPSALPVDVEENDYNDKAAVDIAAQAVDHVKTKEERLFVARLDAVLMTFAFLSQVIKILDQQNVASAYVSGMKEDLHIAGNEYNYFTTYFNIGYAIFVIPSQIMMTKVDPAIWLPSLEIAWGILTLAFFRVQNVTQIYIMRAFVGAFEASAYPGTVTLLAAWYTPRELAFRISVYHSAQWVGSMISSGLTAAIFQGLDGVHGIAGWRWMFIIDAILTVALAVGGFFLIPGYPSKKNPRAFWLNERHLEIANERSKRFGRAANKSFNLRAVKRAFKTPQTLLIPTLYVASQLAQQGYLYFNLWLKSLKNADGSPRWSITQVNALPMAGYAASILCVWMWGFISDRFQNRWIVVAAQGTIGLIPGIMMSVWNIPVGAKYFAYYLCFTFLATTPPLMAWLSDMTPNDAEQRAFIIGCTTASWYAFNSWVNILVWPASKAPHYPVGWQVTIGLWCFIFAMLALTRYVDLYYVRPRNARQAREEAAVESDDLASVTSPDAKSNVVVAVREGGRA
ncbi:hypothetical protein Q8F55_006112 [Vanrija albida]|uniref:Major facilitator superfamily (MFS) profile domain-containing protein n=1 Tax=Vanrija albida TaxID=181172 RepID=A0ABR3Q3I2_9TREE